MGTNYWQASEGLLDAYYFNTVPGWLKGERNYYNMDYSPGDYPPVQDFTNQFQGDACNRLFGDWGPLWPGSCFLDLPRPVDWPFNNASTNHIGSVSMRVKPISDPPLTWDGSLCAKYRADINDRTFWCYVLNHSTEGRKFRLRFGTGTGATSELVHDQALPDWTFTHYKHMILSMKLDTGDWRVKVWDDEDDRVLVNASGTMASPPVPYHLTDWGFGCRKWAAISTGHLEGYYDQIGVWNRFFTEAEMDEIHAKPTTGLNSALRGQSCIRA